MRIWEELSFFVVLIFSILFSHCIRFRKKGRKWVQHLLSVPIRVRVVSAKPS